MIHAVVVTHGRFGEEMVKIAQTIGGEAKGVDVVSLLLEDSPGTFEDKVRHVLGKEEDNLLILADIPGGTPCNVAVSLLLEYDAHIVTGVNLAMILELMTSISFVPTAGEMAERLIQAAKDTTRILDRSQLGKQKNYGAHDEL